jgi:hypothetical protein
MVTRSRLRGLPGVTIADSQAVLAALGAIAGDEGQSAALVLAELLNGWGFERAGEVLIRWAGEERQGSSGLSSNSSGSTRSPSAVSGSSASISATNASACPAVGEELDPVSISAATRPKRSIAAAV